MFDYLLNLFVVVYSLIIVALGFAWPFLAIYGLYKLFS
jgi:hypothetical protein